MLSPNTVYAVVELRATTSPMYNAPHDLTCQVRQFPAEYTQHVVPYISIIWYTPDAVDTQLVDNSSTTPREVMDLENLTSSIIFPSLTASYNGEYLCKAVLSLSNGSEMVLDQTNWTLYLEGKPEVQHYVLVHTYFLVTISSHKPFRINKLTLAHTYLLVTISYTIIVSAISISGNEGIYIAGSPAELNCFTQQTNIMMIQWIMIYSSTDTILATNSDHNSLILTVDTSGREGSESFTCKIVTYSGQQREKKISVNIKGNVSKVTLHSPNYVISVQI